MFDRQIIIGDQIRTYIYDDEDRNNRRFVIKFATTPAIEAYVRRPISLVQGLARIGGFLGFLKIFSLVLSIFHQYLFNKDLK
jgi:hypothetical protein